MESQPPSPLNTRHCQNGAVKPPKVYQSIPSPVALKKTTVSEANRSFPSLSSDEISIELNGQHDYFNHKPGKPSQMVPPSPNMADRSKIVYLERINTVARMKQPVRLVSASSAASFINKSTLSNRSDMFAITF